jgi:hypothetical protein
MPNFIPLRQRLGYGLATVVLMGLAAYSLYFGELPLTSHRTPGVSLMTGPALWFMIPALGLGCIAFLSLIVDHYDRRDNERVYRTVVTWCTRAALLLAFVAYAVDFFLHARSRM